MDLLIVIFDLRYCGKRNLHDLAICNLDFYAGSGEGLGGFHASHCATHAPAVRRNNLHIVLPVQRLQSGECFGDFHKFHPSWDRQNYFQILPFIRQVVYPRRGNEPENIIWRIEPVRVFFG